MGGDQNPRNKGLNPRHEAGGGGNPRDVGLNTGHRGQRSGTQSQRQRSYSRTQKSVRVESQIRGSEFQTRWATGLEAEWNPKHKGLRGWGGIPDKRGSKG